MVQILGISGTDYLKSKPFQNRPSFPPDFGYLLYSILVSGQSEMLSIGKFGIQFSNSLVFKWWAIDIALVSPIKKRPKWWPF